MERFEHSGQPLRRKRFAPLVAAPRPGVHLVQRVQDRPCRQRRRVAFVVEHCAQVDSSSTASATSPSRLPSCSPPSPAAATPPTPGAPEPALPVCIGSGSGDWWPMRWRRRRGGRASTSIITLPVGWLFGTTRVGRRPALDHRQSPRRHGDAGWERAVIASDGDRPRWNGPGADPGWQPVRTEGDREGLVQCPTHGSQGLPKAVDVAKRYGFGREHAELRAWSAGAQPVARVGSIWRLASLLLVPVLHCELQRSKKREPLWNCRAGDPSVPDTRPDFLHEISNKDHPTPSNMFSAVEVFELGPPQPTRVSGDCTFTPALPSPPTLAPAPPHPSY